MLSTAATGTPAESTRPRYVQPRSQMGPVSSLDTGGFSAAPSRWRLSKYEDRLPLCQAIIMERRPSRVLDVGSGDGLFLDSLAAAGIPQAGLTGIEMNADAVQAMIQKGYSAHQISANSPYPFEDGRFDVVFAGEVLEHVFDPNAMLDECRRVLKPGGILLLTTPNLLSWYNRVLVLFGITPFFVEHSYVETYGPKYSLLRKSSDPVGHLRIYNLRPLHALLKRTGFRVLHTGGYAFLPVPVLFQFDRMVSRARPSLGSGFIVTCLRAEE
jgi:2-polyprenyl-3-methyl-5-hydroxy-6-metoxy-1,4-benzoquinol methylase